MSRGGLLPLHHGDGGEVDGEDGDHAGSAPPEFSPSNLQLLISVSVFPCSCGAPSRERRGTFFIGVFRSRQCRWSEDRRQRSHEGQTSGPHTATVPGRVGHPRLVLGPPFVRFLRSQVFFLPNIDAPKIASHLDVVWVPETSKYRK